MRSVAGVSSVLGLAMWISLGIGCKDKNEPTKPTREDCAKVASHMAELMFNDYVAHPDAFWELMHAPGVDPELPPDVTKESFQAWLDTGPGKTWLMKRRGNALSGTQNGIDSCTQNGSKPLMDCLLAAKSKDDVGKCDQKFARAPAAAPTGSAEGSGSAGSGSATGSAAGSAAGSATP
jgi:hypothetical protein